jgi:thioredoxin reductase
VEKFSPFARRIHLISAYELSADRETIEKVVRRSDLNVYENARVLRMFGDGTLKCITIERKETGRVFEIPVRGVFIAIGLHTNSRIIADLIELN